MGTPAQLHKDAQKLADPMRRKNHEWFFQTKKGEYGAGDKFIGLTVPVCRGLAKKYKDIQLENVLAFLRSQFHEERLIALLILVHQFQKGDASTKRAIFRAYLQHTAYVNNWDLVDSSAYQIVGEHLLDKSTKKLGQLAKSTHLWERRIGIVATYAFIRHGRLEETIRIATILLKDHHDLIHKAVGWMLREAGKKDVQMLKKFLRDRYLHMPRTMLRYAIEKFPEDERKRYLRRLS